jgi:DNA repair protein RecO (recombination protein O)
VYLKSDAIVISRRAVMNTSLVLVCYTRRAGRVTVLAKGAQRKRRKDEPPSVPDLFQRGETVLWFGPRREYAILSEWTLEEVRRGIRNAYGAFRAASACAGLVDSLARHDADAGGHFAALDEVMRTLDAGSEPRAVVWAFAFQAMMRAGFVAPLAGCAACGAAPTPRREVVLSAADGGVVCRRCASEVGRDLAGEALPLTPEAASAARFLAATSISSASKLRVSGRCARLLDRAVRRLAEYHLERAMDVLSVGEDTP